MVTTAGHDPVRGGALGSWQLEWKREETWNDDDDDDDDDYSWQCWNGLRLTWATGMDGIVVVGLVGI